MDRILQELDAAYRILSEMPVSGANVKRLAAAEIKLEYVYTELSKIKKEAESDGGQ